MKERLSQNIDKATRYFIADSSPYDQCALLQAVHNSFNFYHEIIDLNTTIYAIKVFDQQGHFLGYI